MPFLNVGKLFSAVEDIGNVCVCVCMCVCACVCKCVGRCVCMGLCVYVCEVCEEFIIHKEFNILIINVLQCFTNKNEQ